MSTITLRQSARVLFLSAFGASFAQAQVTIAERPWVGGITTIQAGVAAALEGETLLVVPGTYAPFTIDAKSVSVFVTGTGEATIAGKVSVKNLGPAQSVVLSRLHVTGNYDYPNGETALDISNVTGHLRVQDSTLKGQKTWNSSYGGTYFTGTGVHVASSLNVVFSACTIEGGDSDYLAGEWVIDGGPGLDSVNSSIALYDCTVEGGYGSSESSGRGGNGGPGYRGLSYGLFAAGCTFEGGGGGTGDSGSYPAGAGGDALVIDAGQAHLLDDTFIAGGGGFPTFPPGGTIVALNGSIIDSMSGTHRKISATRVTADDASVPITITGQPGDAVYLMIARRPTFVWKPMLRGCLLVPVPLFSTALATGTIGASGTLVIPHTFDILDGSASARKYWLQALCVDVSGQPTLTGPAHVLSLDAASTPDCNGNARLDVLDLIFGGEADCNLNWVPDGCDLANGTPDCNANGLPDSCDLAAHTSLDVNLNGVPDECEAQYLTWYVDDSAAAGGNGSQAAPFRYIKQAVAASISGDTIILEDGLYQGQQNYEVDFNGRYLMLRSANGPGNCTIDCQGFGCALKLNHDERAYVEGISFVNGRSSGNGHGGAIMTTGADLTLHNCTFSNCVANTDGGAVYALQGSLRLESCQFTGNSAFASGSLRSGGALFIDRATLNARDCIFENNQANDGGVFYVRWQGGLAVFTHCKFLGNYASREGGAGRFYSPGNTQTFDDCLFAGNSAGISGGAISSTEPLSFTNSTFVSNTAVSKGGAVWFQSASPSAFRNSIAWNNTAGTGAQFCVSAAASGILTVSSSDVQGGQAGVVTSGGNLTWGAGNIVLDPQFVDPDGADNNPLTYGDNDYALSASSPCIDAGDNGSIIPDLLDVDGDGDTSEAMPLDLRHQTRRKDVLGVPDTGAGTAPIVDMGALERQG